MGGGSNIEGESLSYQLHFRSARKTKRLPHWNLNINFLLQFLAQKMYILCQFAIDMASAQLQHYLAILLHSGAKVHHKDAHNIHDAAMQSCSLHTERKRPAWQLPPSSTVGLKTVLHNIAHSDFLFTVINNNNCQSRKCP